ncbi:MAG TPA: O-antigen ligase family protein [Thermoanaerobaculia bacterium]|nr:O-antigen ligase family protein [Thermoanaerobaculia bacterium]
MPLPRLIPPGVLPHSLSLRIAILSYLAHLLCEGWIGSSEAFLGIAVIAAFVAWKRGELRLAFHPLYLPLALFVAASFASALISPPPLDSLLAAGEWSPFLAFPFPSSLVPPGPFQSLLAAGEWFPFLTFPLALILYANVRGLARSGAGALLALAIFQSSFGLAQYLFFNHDTLERRITGTTAHVMTFSGILLPLSLLFISLSLSRAGTTAHRVAAVLTTLALALTFTRGAWIGWTFGILTIVALRRIRLIPWLAPLFLLALTFSPEPIFARLVSSFDLQQTSVLDRIRMAEAGVEMVRDHPLFGVGPGNIKEVYPLYRKDDAPRFRIPHLHSNPIQIWAERGVLAFAAWAALLVLFLRESAGQRRRRPQAAPWVDGGMAAALGLAVFGLFEFNFGDTEVLLTMLDVWALTLALGGAAEASEPVPDVFPGAVPAAS